MHARTSAESGLKVSRFPRETSNRNLVSIEVSIVFYLYFCIAIRNVIRSFYVPLSTFLFYVLFLPISRTFKLLFPCKSFDRSSQESCDFEFYFWRSFYLLPIGSEKFEKRRSLPFLLAISKKRWRIIINCTTFNPNYVSYCNQHSSLYYILSYYP